MSYFFAILKIVLTKRRNHSMITVSLEVVQLVQMIQLEYRG